MVEFVVLVVLVVVGFLVYQLYLADGSVPFNKELRESFLKSSFTRSVLALNRPGDQRFIYLNQDSNKLTVEVDIQAGIVPNHQYKMWLTQMIKDTTGKIADIRESYDSDILPKPAFSYTELLSMAKKTRDPLLAAQPNYLHVLYLGESSNEPTNVGMVLTATDIFLFKQVVIQLSDRESIRSKIERSTIMHEWGHLLGLEHVALENCIMNEKVEVYENKKFQGSNLPTDYCAEEEFWLMKLRTEAGEKK